MAVLPGEIADGPIHTAIFQPNGSLELSALAATTLTDVVNPTINSDAHTGDVAVMREDIWGGGVHSYFNEEARYGIIDVGTIRSIRELTLTVHNAGDTDRTLDGIVATVNGTGVSFLGHTLPVVIPARKDLTFTVEVVMDGPETIDSTFTVDLATGTDGLLFLLGERLVARTWVLGPDWNDPVLETWEFRTDVQIAKSRQESRRQMYENPRRELEWRVATTKPHILDRMLTGWQSNLWLVPRWHDRSFLVTAAAVDDTTIFLDTTIGEWQVGESVVLLLDENTTENRVVSAITATSIDLVDPLETAFPVGTEVYPARLMRTPLNTEVIRPTDGFSITTVAMLADKFTVHPIVADKTTWLTVTFDDNGPAGGGTVQDLLTIKPNWISGQTHEYETLGVEIDPGAGLRLVDNPDLIPLHQKTYRFALRNRSEVDDFLAFLLAQQGRLNTFWIPTWSQDFTVISPISDTATVMEVEIIDWEAWYQGQLNREYFALYLRDGTWVIARVIASSISAGKEVWTMEWAFSLASQIQPEDIAFSMWIEHVRLDTDRIEVAWLTDRLAEIELPFRGLPK